MTKWKTRQIVVSSCLALSMVIGQGGGALLTATALTNASYTLKTLTETSDLPSMAGGSSSSSGQSGSSDPVENSGSSSEDSTSGDSSASAPTETPSLSGGSSSSGSAGYPDSSDSSSGSDSSDSSSGSTSSGSSSGSTSSGSTTKPDTGNSDSSSAPSQPSGGSSTAKPEDTGSNTPETPSKPNDTDSATPPNTDSTPENQAPPSQSLEELPELAGGVAQSQALEESQSGEDGDENSEDGDETGEETGDEDPDAIATIVAKHATADFQVTFPTHTTAGNAAGAASEYTVEILVSHYLDGEFVFHGMSAINVTSTSGTQSATKTVQASHHTERRFVEQADGTYKYEDVYMGYLYSITNVNKDRTLTFSLDICDLTPVNYDYGDGSPYISGSYDSIQIWATLYNTTLGRDVVLDQPLPIILDVEDDRATQNISGTLSTTTPTNKTTATFSQVGEYSLSYFLENYNAISLNEIELNHIVGPVICLDYAARTGYSTDVVSIPDSTIPSLADYSRGIPSYIGEIISGKDSLYNAAFVSTYGFDRIEDTAGTFTAPAMYTREDNAAVFSIGSQYYKIQQVMPSFGSNSFVSPNDYGDTTNNYGGLLQNDSFINETTLKNTLTQGSTYIYENGVQPLENIQRTQILVDLNDSNTFGDKVSYDGSTLNIDYGSSYIITDSSGSSGLSLVNVAIPDEFKIEFVYGESDPYPTTINLMQSALSTKNYGGNTYYMFPYTTLDEKSLISGNGSGHEYNTLGNKIIWNLPWGASGDMTDTNPSPYYLSFSKAKGSVGLRGHLIAPYADIRNYGWSDSDVPNGWQGGNLNGAVMANSIQLGSVEFHMWPYGEASVAQPEIPKDPIILPDTGGLGNLPTTLLGLAMMASALYLTSRKRGTA